MADWSKQAAYVEGLDGSQDWDAAVRAARKSTGMPCLTVREYNQIFLAELKRIGHG